MRRKRLTWCRLAALIAVVILGGWHQEVLGQEQKPELPEGWIIVEQMRIDWRARGSEEADTVSRAYRMVSRELIVVNEEGLG